MFSFVGSQLVVILAAGVQVTNLRDFLEDVLGDGCKIASGGGMLSQNDGAA